MTSDAVKFLALLALLFVGSAGWGAAAVWVLHRTGWKSTADQLGHPLQLVLGMALFMAVGGILVAFDSAELVFLVAWHVAGVALFGWRLSRTRRHRSSLPPRELLAVVTTVAVWIVLVLSSIGLAIGYAYYNPNDDDAAYVYLAKRLLSTGGLIDPFNARRMTSYGGATLYHALFLGVTGNSSLRGFEFTFAVLLLILVTVGTVRRRWLALGTLLIGVGILFGDAIGPVQNLSPTLSASAVSLAAYQLLSKVPRTSSSERSDEPALYIVIGVVVGAILALRFYYVFSVAIAALIALVLARRRHSVRAILLCGGATLVSVSGWAVALYRSSRTPLFPLFKGNYNSAYPLGPGPLSAGIGAYAHRLWAEFNGYWVGWVALLSIAIGVGALIVGIPDRQSMAVLVAAGIGCLAQMVVFSFIFSGFATIEIDRFEGPSTLACGLFAVNALWPMRERIRRPAPRDDHQWVGHPTWRVRARALVPRVAPWRPLASGPAILVLLAGTTYVIFGGSPHFYWHNVDFNTRQGLEVLKGEGGFTDRYASLRSEYHRINEAIPRGAKVFAAVDDPSLLSFSRYEFVTLDEPGAVSPPPHMPFFNGAQAKVTYLRRLGFQYIVASSPSAPGSYQRRSEERNLHSPNYNYRKDAPYYLDWLSSVASLERGGSYPVLYAGTLGLIDIRPP